MRTDYTAAGGTDMSDMARPIGPAVEGMNIGAPGTVPRYAGSFAIETGLTFFRMITDIITVATALQNNSLTKKCAKR